MIRFFPQARWLLLAALHLVVSTSQSAASASPPAMPMPVFQAETANHRRLAKPVIESRLVDNMEQTNRWSHHGHGVMSFTTDRAHEGRQAVRVNAPTKTDRPNPVTGRPFGEAVVRREVAGENWTDFNRLSFWVYPHLPGFKVISMLVKLRNEGATRVPDGYGREGLHYVLLQPDQWNHVVWEIPHLARDKVTGVEFIYRLQGHEPGATHGVCFDIDQLELQRVDPDFFEGWSVAPGRIAYCHSGYPIAAMKVALANGVDARQFRLASHATGKTAYAGRVQKSAGGAGGPDVLDFSDFRVPGIYRIEAGAVQTPWFAIGDDAWCDSIWKTINFFFCERCGYPVPGIHATCHGDWQARHGTNVMVINGGWHDAGDLSQGLVNTAESTYAMLALAEEASQASLAPLTSTLLQESRWGLDWILKTRFGDGFRVTWATMDYWTDGELGTPDDTLGDVRNSPFDNFLAAATEALAAQVFNRNEPALANRSLAAARDDWRFAVAKTQSPNLELASAGAQASIELFKATGEPAFADKAVEFAAVIVASQQRERTDWKAPLAGFFYTGPKRDRLLHYSHRGHEQAPIVALAALCELLPRHADWMRWYSTVALHSEYLKRIARFTEPWGMLPASVYSLDESNDPRFKEQVRNGIQLSDTHYLRRFPVWFDLRGNCGTVLSQTKALSAAARLRRDPSVAGLVQKQIEWTLGRNPFGQSLMFGEGHDYAPQYTAMSGDMVGSLPVGIQTRENHDEPYWPAANCYNYAEVWVHPSARWLAIMADAFPPLQVDPVRKDSLIDFVDVQSRTRDDVITIRATVRGQGRQRLTVRASNLALDASVQTIDLKPRRAQTLTWTARRVSPKEPWVAVVMPEESSGARRDLIGW